MKLATENCGKKKLGYSITVNPVEPIDNVGTMLYYLKCNCGWNSGKKLYRYLVNDLVEKHYSEHKQYLKPSLWERTRLT